MGKPSEPETERNKAIYNDFKLGLNYVDLVSKYRITSQRIWQIIKREKNKEKPVNYDIQKCPDCGSTHLEFNNDAVICLGCGSTFTTAK